jgi:signal transduction histidine kinase
MSGGAGRVAAVLGHELRNPLAAALTGTAVLRELLDPGDARIEVADGVLRDLQRLSQLLDSYLGLARLGRPARVRVDLGALCAAVHGRRPAVVRVEPGATCLVAGDPHLLERALENLVDNALHAGARSVALRIEAADGRGRILVDDDGPGVPPDLRAHVFEPGFSGRGSTGLGLCIVAEVAAAHGGSARCEPRAGGARFCIELPVAEALSSRPVHASCA